MSVIKRLSQDTVDKIAAGEVIENISNVVKELVDNSLDAKSKKVQVYLQNSGRDLIKVVDDGVGMLKEDLLMCFLPHTTSKIDTFDDLQTVTSLGFRGEALGSIGAISNISIKTRVNGNNLGNIAIVRGGILEDTYETGMPVGTCVEVSDIFYNVPVKKKHLSKSKNELLHVVNLLVEFAIIYPDVDFSLINDKKKILDTSYSKNIVSRYELLFGNDFVHNFIPVNFHGDYIHVTGYLARPQQSLKRRSRQYLYVNNRRVVSSDLLVLVEQAFGTLLEVKAFPQFFLHMHMPTNFYDANAHPKKENVIFYNHSFVSATLYDAVKETLEKYDLTYSNTPLLNSDKLKDSVYLDYTTTSSTTSKTRDIIQIHRLFLAYETPRGFCLIDQHAAHERILYESFLNSAEQNLHENSILETPAILRVNPSMDVLLLEYFDDLKRLGFDIQSFGKNSYKVYSCPRVFWHKDIVTVLTGVLEDLQEGNSSISLNERYKLILSYMACRAAIKSGDYLNAEERTELVEKLENTKTRYTCPHGRPTSVEISTEDLYKVFKRIV